MSAASRRAELARIRQLFIPDMVMRLHALFLSQHIHAPIFVQKALDLSKIVAEEDNHVYQEFFGKGSNPFRLIAYLEKLRDASLLSLEISGVPFRASEQ